MWKDVKETAQRKRKDNVREKGETKMINLIELFTRDIYFEGEYLCTIGRLSVRTIPNIKTKPGSILHQLVQEIEEYKRQRRADQ